MKSEGNTGTDQFKNPLQLQSRDWKLTPPLPQLPLDSQVATDCPPGGWILSPPRLSPSLLPMKINSGTLHQMNMSMNHFSSGNRQSGRKQATELFLPSKYCVQLSNWWKLIRLQKPIWRGSQKCSSQLFNVGNTEIQSGSEREWELAKGPKCVSDVQRRQMAAPHRILLLN